MKNGFHAGSPAFRQAVLKSERLRILIVLGIIVAVFLVRSFLTLILWDHENFHLWLLSCALLSLFLLYEFFIYRAVSRAVRSGSNLSAGLRITNVIIETPVRRSLSPSSTVPPSILPTGRWPIHPRCFFSYLLFCRPCDWILGSAGSRESSRRSAISVRRPTWVGIRRSVTERCYSTRTRRSSVMPRF